MLLPRRLVNSIVVESREAGLVCFGQGSAIDYWLSVESCCLAHKSINRLFSSPLGNFGAKVIFFL